MAVDLNKWRRLIASREGPKSPTTRLVLHTLAVHMDKSGGSCFPSTKILSIESGLSERVVCHHIKVAADAGWIAKEVAGHTGQGWRRNQYQAGIPKALTESKCLKGKGTDGELAPFDKGTDFERKKALTQGQSNYTIELSSNKHPTFFLKDGSEFVIDDQFLATLKTSYPTLNIDTELLKVKAWAYSNPSKRKTRSGAKRFVNGWMQKAADNNGSNRTMPQSQPKEFDFENQFKTA